MAYTPTTWVNDDGSGTVGTAINATRLNNIETGVVQAQPPARQDTVVTTASLAANAGENGTVTLATGFRLLRIQTSRAARVRLYTTPTKRTDDASRLVSVDPSGDHGLIVEVITTNALYTLDLSPVPHGNSMENTPSASIAYRIENLDTVTGTVAVTFTWQKLEI